MALLEGLKNHPKVIEKMKEDNKDPTTLKITDDTRKLLEALPPDNYIRQALIPLLESAKDDFDKALESMEKWYEEAMDRVTGWYKRWSQFVLLVLAFIVALVLNADTFNIGKEIYRDQTLRESLVAAAGEVVKSRSSTPQTPAATTPSAPQKKAPATSSTHQAPQTTAPATSSAPQTPPAATPSMPQTSAPGTASGTQNPAASTPANIQQPSSSNPSTAQEPTSSKPPSSNQQANDIEIIKNYAPKLPLGWPEDEDILAGIQDPSKLLGILFTAILVSLGSTFWFELLNKLVNLRNAGKKPLTKDELEAQKSKAKT